MSKAEPRCGSCGHPKSSHTEGRGRCSHVGESCFCRCSRYSRPRLEVEDITLLDIVNLMIRGGADHLVLEIDFELDGVTLTVSDEAGNCKRGPGDPKKSRNIQCSFNDAEKRLQYVLDLNKETAE